MKEVNMLNSDTQGTRSALLFAEAGACDALADRAREVQNTRREKVNWIKTGHLAAFDWLLEFLSY